MEKILEKVAINRQQEYALFRNYFNEIIRLLCESPKNIVNCIENDNLIKPTPVVQWLRRLLEYNVPCGKLNRGLSVVINYRLLKPDANEQSLQQARLLGWCLELFQTSFLLVDDIMDRSIIRRNRPCWYRLVGMMACNDSMLLESCIFHLLHQQLGQHPHYIDLVQLMHRGFHITTIGQCLDGLTEKSLNNNYENNDKNNNIKNGIDSDDHNDDNSTINLKNFNADRYREIVASKTSFYSFALPLRLALLLANITDGQLHQRLETIQMDIGELFQINDDYLDCFGCLEQIGKIGTDIIDGKCSWLIVTALELLSDTNTKDNDIKRKIIEKHYGQSNEESEKLIKNLYTELKLKQIYHDYHQRKIKDILKKIEQFYIDLPHMPNDLFNESLSHVFL